MNRYRNRRMGQRGVLISSREYPFREHESGTLHGWGGRISCLFFQLSRYNCGGGHIDFERPIEIVFLQHGVTVLSGWEASEDTMGSIGAVNNGFRHGQAFLSRADVDPCKTYFGQRHGAFDDLSMQYHSTMPPGCFDHVPWEPGGLCGRGTYDR